MQDAIEYEIGEGYNTTVGGTDYRVLPVSAPAQGMSQYYYAAKKGDFIVCIILSVGAADSADDVLATLA